MQTADHDGVAIAYEERGRDPAGAETVVLCEGLGYGRWMWNWQADALADSYHVVLWDNRGTGESDVPEGPYTIDQLAGGLEAVLADAGVEAAHVVGASMGGMVAQRYALSYDRAGSLALLCTSPGGPDAVSTPESTLEHMFSVPDGADEREAIRYKMAPAVTDGFIEANPDLIERIVDWRLESDAPPSAREAQAAAVRAFDASDELDALDVPVLVAHGTDDRVLPVGNGELLAEAIPDAESAFVEGGSHLFFIEESERVNDLLVGFLADG
ncbi:alpha/beta fold hydrolase [Halobaculum gomorrense]|uniref:Pimeloyl-ACP methyl ester carboxylesterase n=1 Tax=Halobaculum gomorrense TaxID=43928 RepID=A0A1M5PM34_9EURY|nr:alpha/beta hydrolase [Halobaculum gomorrense]SHH02313.1 Pimeloyl-ACP methyl ester carboxylesterase [Halobaculum gomorrense]